MRGLFELDAGDIALVDRDAGASSSPSSLAGPADGSAAGPLALQPPFESDDEGRAPAAAGDAPAAPAEAAPEEDGDGEEEDGEDGDDNDGGDAAGPLPSQPPQLRAADLVDALGVSEAEARAMVATLDQGGAGTAASALPICVPASLVASLEQLLPRLREAGEHAAAQAIEARLAVLPQAVGGAHPA